MNDMTKILTPNDLAEAVRATAMLADVTLSLWGAEKSDARIMDKVKADAGAVGNVGRVVKNMLAGADEKLKETRGAYQAVRSQHYALTLPWVGDPHAERARGPRLLPNLLFERYLTDMSKRKRAALAALDDFVLAYPDLVIQAKSNLAGMADANYPTADEVRGSFRVAFDFEPIPAGTAFRGLPEHMLDKLSRGLVAKQQRMVEGAAAAMWAEVRERVTHAVSKLTDVEAKFRETTVESVRDLTGLMPAWNLTNDPRAEEIAEDIARMLGGVDATQLRKNVNMRKDVAEQAQGIVNKMEGWNL